MHLFPKIPLADLTRLTARMTKGATAQDPPAAHAFGVDDIEVRTGQPSP